MSRIITCTNTDGGNIRFGAGFTPWLLTNVEGVYQMDANVSMSDNAMSDGATYYGSVLRPRNIIMTMVDKRDYQNDRELLYDVFRHDVPGIFVYSENGRTREIDYVTESVEISSTGRLRTAVVSLQCPEPRFRDNFDTEVLLAGWQGWWEFPHTFPPEGEAIGGRVDQSETIRNDTAANKIGVTIRMIAEAEVTNPSVTCIETGQTIRVNTTMQAGDEIKITTGINDKHIYLIQDGAETEINALLDPDSRFFMLSRGGNTLSCAADSGLQHLTVAVLFRWLYPGV